MTTPLFIILFLWQPSSFTMFHVYTEILATRNPTCSLLILDSVGLHISFHSRILPYSILSTGDCIKLKKLNHLILGLVSSLTLSAHITILYYSIYCFSIHYTVCLLLDMIFYSMKIFSLISSGHYKYCGTQYALNKDLLIELRISGLAAWILIQFNLIQCLNELSK